MNRSQQTTTGVYTIVTNRIIKQPERGLVFGEVQSEPEVEVLT
jgi:hypothetical protein